MSRRRQSRELALQALYFIDTRSGDPEDGLALFHRNFTPPRKARDFMNQLVQGVSARREAIDLGKKYGTDESGAFINGILDRIRKAMENGEAVKPPGGDDNQPADGRGQIFQEIESDN